MHGTDESVYLRGMARDKWEDGIPHCAVVTQRKSQENNLLNAETNPQMDEQSGSSYNGSGQCHLQ